jgi:subtilase family serine protease
VRPIPGCNPNATTNTPNGGSQTIAIVDAYDDPNAASDLAYFSAQFGLPNPGSKFHVVYAKGAQPAQDPSGGWELEESLDIEYAHAMAPNATIYLVEANSDYDSDLYPAVLVASNLVNCGKTTACPAGSKGRGEVSMSWGGGEFPQESELDSFFTAPGVVYFAAAGDSPGVIYPCASPNVVCAGGTTNARSLQTGNLIAQIAWSDAGGGVSFYEPIPSYQASDRRIVNLVGTNRGVPDISADSNPNTGVWIYDTFPYPGLDPGWIIVGGTSVATPTLAGVVNATGQFAKSSAEELTSLYSHHGFGNWDSNLTDIVYGACSPYSSAFSGPGWDLCTGLGTPNGFGQNW